MLNCDNYFIIILYVISVVAKDYFDRFLFFESNGVNKFHFDDENDKIYVVYWTGSLIRFDNYSCGYMNKINYLCRDNSIFYVMQYTTIKEFDKDGNITKTKKVCTIENNFTKDNENLLERNAYAYRHLPIDKIKLIEYEDYIDDSKNHLYDIDLEIIEGYYSI